MTLNRSQEVKEMILKDINDIGKKAGLRGFELVGRYPLFWVKHHFKSTSAVQQHPVTLTMCLVRIKVVHYH